MFFIFKVRRSWVYLNLWVWSVRIINPINVPAGYSSWHGLLGPLARHFNLVFILATKNKRNGSPRGGVAVSVFRALGPVTAGDGYREGQCAPSVPISSTHRVQSTEPATFGHWGKTWSEHVVPRPGSSFTGNPLEMQILWLHPRQAEAETPGSRTQEFALTIPRVILSTEKFENLQPSTLHPMLDGNLSSRY